ncbi:MAG: type II toxin-antitoxin system RelE/ParE family toxin [Phycisphaerae bacterium]|nr:type II toxin-antitoxin system RelE/ParE family toxin [Phycisphaerae bacterium]
MKFEFHPEALKEFESAAQFYTQRQTDLGLRFIESVEAALNELCESPYRWPFLEQDVRRYLVHVFPYAVLYSIDSDRVLILAIMHCSRRPSYWRHRVERS